MLAPLVAQHVPLIRDYITETPLVCLADPNFALPVGGDEFWGNVALLCNFEGADLSTNVVDSSIYGATSSLFTDGTAELLAQIRTSDKKFGTSSWRCSYAQTTGVSDRLVVFASRAEYAMPGDFTIEFWIKKDVFFGGTYYAMVGNASGAHQWVVRVSSAGSYFFSGANLTINGGPGGEIAASGGTTDVWEHVAFARQGGTIRAFLNGVLKNTGTCTGSVPQHEINLFGSKLSGGWTWLQNDDFVDDLRITVGAARYTATFTPPAATYPSGYVPATTALSMHFNGAVGPAATVDSSAYARTITTVAPAALTTVDKKYGAASGAPGATGYWSAADASELRMGAGDFTAEAWVKAAQPGAGDPDWGKVLLLLDNSEAITKDSSPYNRTVVTNGSPSLTTPQLFGRNTYLMGPSGNDRLVIADDTFLSAGNHSEEWCIELWVYPTGANGDGMMFSFGAGSVYSMKRNVNGSIYANCSNISSSSYGLGPGAGAVPANQWTHIAWVRDNTSDASWGYMHIYINGVRNGTSASFGKTHTVANFGAGTGYMMGYNSGSSMLGSRANMRITRGTARYYANFTPASTNLPASATSGLVLGQVGSTAIAANQWALALVPQGYGSNDANFGSVKMLLPFDSSVTQDLNTAQTNTFTNIGSMALDTTTYKFGSGSLNKTAATTDETLRVVSPSALRSNTSTPCTLEFWFYPTGNVGDGAAAALRNCIVGLFNGNPTSAANKVTWFWWKSSGGGTFGWANGGNITGVAVNTWHHVALVYIPSVNKRRFFLDGVLQYSDAVPHSTENFDRIFVGNCGTQAAFEDGSWTNNVCAAKVDSLRFTDGVARYTANFTPPAKSFPTSGALMQPRLAMLSGVSGEVSADVAFPWGAWTHVAVARQAGTIRLFQNGALLATDTDTTDFSSAVGVRVGGAGSGFKSISGNVDELRLTKGAALRTAAFTVATYPNCDGLTGTNEPVPAPSDTDTPSPLAFDVVETPCLDATQSAALSSVVIVSFNSASTSPTAVYTNVPPGLTPTLTWIGPTAGTLALAGTPTTPGNYRFIAKFYENNSTKVLGTSECDITVWPAAGTFSPGAMNNPTGRVGVPATLQLTAPSANYNVDISVVANLPVPGMELVTAWTPGVTSSGTVSLVGTPTAAGTYNLTVTYRRKSTCEVRNLAASTHTVTIGALAAPPAPAPAPAPAPSPAPAPAPTPPGISRGPVPDNLWASVALLQQFNNVRSVMYEYGDSAVGDSTLYMDATGTMEMGESGGYGYSVEGAGDTGSIGGGAGVVGYAGGSRWAMDGNLTVECFFRMSAKDQAYLFGASANSVYLQLLHFSVTGRAMVWSLGMSSVLIDGRRVVRPAFIVGRTGGPSGSTPVVCFGAELSPPPFAFMHVAGQRVRSGATDEMACWFNGVGGAPTKINASGSAVSIGSGNNLATGGSFKPNCSATGGPAFNSGPIYTGYMDQVRVTKAQRYTATAGITDAIDRAKITPPFAAS